MGRRPEEPVTELDLLPILNLVLIMIPLLLLGLVFVEIAVVDVTMASRSPSSATPPTEAPPPKLQVLVTKDGEIVVSLNDNPLDPIKAKAAGDGKAPVDRYDWCRFYNLLAELKNGGSVANGLDYSKVAQFDLILAEDVTFDVMVRTMDVARYGRTTQAAFKASDVIELKPMPTFTCDDKDTAFNESRAPRVNIEENGKTVRGFNILFPGTVLGMPQRN